MACENKQEASNDTIHIVPYEELWQPPPVTNYEFGISGIVRAPQGGVKFTDVEEVNRQKGVIMHLVKSLGSNLLEGKSMINISLPVRIFEPRSFLQRMTDIWAYAPLFLTKAAKEKDAVERIKWIVVWFISGLHRGTTNQKPFNPILGETFQGRYIDGTNVYIEQVSHHPPISMFQLLGPNHLWHYHGHHECTASFRPNGIIGGQSGPNFIEFFDGGCVTFSMPRVKLSGIVFGDRFYSYIDKMVFEDKANDVKCELTLDPDALSGVRAWIQSASTPCDTIRGKISRSDEVVSEMEGSWLDDIKFSGQVYWRQGEYRAYSIIPLPEDQVLPSDSRFRSDLIALKKGDYVTAQSEKERLEVEQRRDRKLRKENSIRTPHSSSSSKSSKNDPRSSPASSPSSVNDSNPAPPLTRSSSFTTWYSFNTNTQPTTLTPEEAEQAALLAATRNNNNNSNNNNNNNNSNTLAVDFHNLHLDPDGDKRKLLDSPRAADSKDELTGHLSRKTIVPVNQGAEQTEVFCLKFSPDSRHLACGCGDGSVRVFNSVGRLAYMFNVGFSKLPTTCIRFRPEDASSKNKNVMLVGNADGTVSYWHMTSQKCIYTIEETDNQIYTLDYRNDGEQFATAGRDCKVRVYEEATKTLVRTLSSGKTQKTAGHSNRIYAVKYKPDDSNVILSGGWDNTVQIWDVRAGQSVRSIYGPHICGDALDINKNGFILTGSWQPDHSLQLWDFGSGKLIQDISWNRYAAVEGPKMPEMIYAAAFSPETDLIAAGGTGTNEGKIFDVRHDYKSTDRVFMGEKGVYCLSFSDNGRKLAFAGGAGDISLLDLK